MEEEQLEDRRNVGESSCISGDGTDQSLQTTRKKNNWKTEETLARAAVALETERINLNVYDDDD
jgi:hypothetical protein